MPGGGPGTPGQLPATMMSATRRTMPRGANLFHEQDDSSRVYVVHAGLVKLVVSAGDGTPSLFDIRGAGDVVGALSALDGRPRPYRAVTMTEATVSSIDGLLEVVKAQPELALAFLVDFCHEFRNAMHRIAARTTDDATTLVARCIARLAVDDRFAPYRTVADGCMSIRVPLSQEDLASWAGVSHRSTSSALRQLRDEGLIRTGRMRLEVLDLPAFAAVSGAADGV